MNKTKVNVDTSIFEVEGHFDFGCVGRNLEEGIIINMFSGYRKGHINPANINNRLSLRLKGTANIVV